jgi:DnaJ like chaperone protein
MSSQQASLPSRLDSELSRLLEELGHCGHQAQELVYRTRLPRWCRPALFYMLGYIARSEGRVSEKDIHFAEALMKSLGLSKRQRRRAIKRFQAGKLVSKLPAPRALTLRIARPLWPSPALRVAICLCHGAQLHGRPGQARRYRYEDALDQLGLPPEVSDDILESYARKAWITRPETQPAPTTLEQACELIGVTRRTPYAEIKRSYRKKVSQCHPDKLARQNLDDAQRALAKDRLLRYQQAWEIIKRHY